jgi:hypothetical protein
MENTKNFDYGVEILLDTPDDFLKIKETLSRIGIASKKNNTLFQTCCIFHKQGTYSIVHFLEMFKLDGRETNISDDDYRRRNTIAKLLSQWGLCKLVNYSDVEFTVPVSEIKIIPYKDKKDWVLVSKYTVGGKK